MFILTCRLLLPKGQIGKFDFQTMLIQLVTALALLKVAQIVVDLIAIYVKDLRKMYYAAKFEETEDFSDIRDTLADRTEVLLQNPSQGAR